MLKNDSSIGTTTDFDGTARLVVPSEFTNKDSYTISIGYTGYAIQEISFTPNKVDTNIVHPIQLQEEVMLGSPLVIGWWSLPKSIHYNWIELRISFEEKNTLDNIDEKNEKKLERKEENSDKKIELIEKQPSY